MRPSGACISRLASHGLASASSSGARLLAGCGMQAAAGAPATTFGPPVQYMAMAGYKAENKAKPGVAQRQGTAKKGGQSTVDEANPRLQAILQMLTPPETKELPLTDEDQAKMAKMHHLRVKEGHAWLRDLTIKHELQLAALKALPKHLREKAMQPDLTPFPPNRKFMFDTPPESYRD